VQVRHGGCGCSATGAAQQQHCSATVQGPAPGRNRISAALLWALRVVCVHMAPGQQAAGGGDSTALVGAQLAGATAAVRLLRSCVSCSIALRLPVQQHEPITAAGCLCCAGTAACQRRCREAPRLQRWLAVAMRQRGSRCGAMGAAQQQQCSVTAAVQHDSSGAARQQQCRGPAPERCSIFESPAALLWTLRVVCVHMVRSAAAAALALCHTLLAQHGAGCCTDPTPSSACVCPCKWRGFTAACCRLRSAVLTQD